MIEKELETVHPTVALLSVYVQIHDDLSAMFKRLCARLCEIRRKSAKSQDSKHNDQTLLNTILRLHMLVWDRHVIEVRTFMEYLNNAPLSSQNICAFVVLLWKYEYRDLADWFSESRFRGEYKSFMRYISQTILESESDQRAVDDS